VYNGLAFDCVLTLISTQTLLKGMVQAIARVCAAGLTRLREIHFVLASLDTFDARGFRNLITSAIGDLYIPHPLQLRAYDTRVQNLTLRWPQAGVVLELSDLTLDLHCIYAHDLNIWAHNSGRITAVTMVDVVIDMPDHTFLTEWGISGARRLVFRRTHIVSDGPPTPDRSWATHWDTVRAMGTNLEELVFEDCGYVQWGTDGKSFVPADDVTLLVLERDAEALRALHQFVSNIQQSSHELVRGLNM
jgi:hypothetical protein